MRALGASLVVLSPQTQEHGAEVARKLRLTFPVLSDAGNAYARELGLVFALPDDLREIYRGFGIDLPATNGDDSWELPLPARIVVDRGGVVRRIDADPDYTVRPEPAATLDVLREISG